MPYSSVLASFHATLPPCPKSRHFWGDCCNTDFVLEWWLTFDANSALGCLHYVDVGNVAHILTAWLKCMASSYFYLCVCVRACAHSHVSHAHTRMGWCNSNTLESVWICAVVALSVLIVLSCFSASPPGRFWGRTSNRSLPLPFQFIFLCLYFNPVPYSPDQCFLKPFHLTLPFGFN